MIMAMVAVKPKINDRLIQFYYFSKITTITADLTPNCKQQFVQTMTNRTLQKKIFQLSCSLLGLAVILGAFGAHGLKKFVSEADVDVFKTGVQYHFIHAIGMLILALSLRRIKEKVVSHVFYLFTFGILLFCGSLYALVFTKAIGMSGGLGWLGAITPIGGLCFMVGWFSLAIYGYRPQESNSSRTEGL
jgi:uncharacterized membrane protein YgdD (TMEM256/DUF423 family)